MQDYIYTKEADAETLADEVLLNDTLHPLVTGINVGSEKVDNIVIHTSRVLLSAEEDELIAIINKLTPSNPLTIRNMIRTVYVNPAVEFGGSIKRIIAAENMRTSRTYKEVRSLLESFNLIMTALDSGAISTALTMAKEVEATIKGGTAVTGLDLEFVKEIIKRLERYLGLQYTKGNL